MYTSAMKDGKKGLFPCRTYSAFFKTTAHEDFVAVALERKSIKIPLRSLGEYSAGIIVQFARITRISRVFLP